MKSSDLLEFFGVAFVVTLIAAACTFLFSSYNHLFLSRVGGTLVKIAGVILGIMLMVYLSEMLQANKVRIRGIMPFMMMLAEGKWSKAVSILFGVACGVGVLVYFYPVIAPFTWLAWFFAAVLIVSFVALQPRIS